MRKHRLASLVRFRYALKAVARAFDMGIGVYATRVDLFDWEKIGATLHKEERNDR